MIENLLAGLDDEQRLAAKTIGGPVVIIAGAGSGKTRTITHRMAYAALSGQQSANSMLALTFTTRAAGELRDRLIQLGLPKVQARTFHSAALRQLKFFWPKFSGQELFEVISNNYRLVAEAAARHRLPNDTAMIRDLLSEISWCKARNITSAQYPELAAQVRRGVSIDYEQVAKVFDEYETVKKRAGLLDFDDLLLLNVGMLQESATIAAQIQATYRHFVVDEYQDVSPIQRTLLSLWLGENDDLCVVGDPNQAIHGFAGADRRFLLNFEKEFPGARRVTLRRNYRSTPEILALANSVIAGRATASKAQVPVRPSGKAVDTRQFPTEAMEATDTAGWLKECHASGLPWSGMAVLFRINSQAPKLEAALAAAEIPYQTKGMDRFWERTEIRAAVRGLRMADVTPDQPPLETVRATLTKFGWSVEPPAGSGKVRERWESLQSLIELIEELMADEPTFTYATMLTQVLELSNREFVPNPDSVTLSTMHSSKGLEWPAVAVVGMQEGLVPFVLASEPEQLAEEQRLAYVALTRAQDVLRVSWSGDRRGGGKSRFLVSLRDVPSTSSKWPAKKPKTIPKCKVCRKRLQNANEIKMGRHLGCPAKINLELLEALREWRAATAKENGYPAYVIFTDVTMMALAESSIGTPEELLDVPGIGPRKLELYGEAILELLREHEAVSGDDS